MKKIINGKTLYQMYLSRFIDDQIDGFNRDQASTDPRATFCKIKDTTRQKVHFVANCFYLYLLFAVPVEIALCLKEMIKNG